MSTKLFYNKFVDDWMHALPLGNGRIGAMVYGNPNTDTVEFNEESLWSGKQLNEENHATKSDLTKVREFIKEEDFASASKLATKSFLSNPSQVRFYETFGNLFIDFEDKSTCVNYSKTLELDRAIATISYQKNDVKYNIESFISEKYDVFTYNITTSSPISLTISYNREKDATITTANDNTLILDGRVTFLTEPDYGDAGEGVSFGSIIKVISNGNQTANNNRIYISNATKSTIYCAFRTNYNVNIFNFDEKIDYKKLLENDIINATSTSFNEIKNLHVIDHQKLFNKVSFKLDVPLYENVPTNERLQRVKNGEIDDDLCVLYYNFGRYLLIESSAKRSTLPANLQGIWSSGFRPAWGADYHTNINLQINYWPAEVANLTESVNSLTHFIKMISKFGEKTAKELFFCNGWAINHTTDIFGRTGIHGSVRYGFFPIAGAWLCLALLEHYEFNNDINYLKEVYPILKGACEFIFDYLIENDDGLLITSPSNSPENLFYYYNKDGDKKVSMLTEGCTFDNEVIYALLTRIKYANEILAYNNDFSNKVDKVLSKLPPIKISKRYGTIQEWINDYEEWEPGHRHISHLFGLYPGDQINESNTVIYQGAKNTIERRLSFGGGQTGWSRAWIMNFYARLKDGDKVLENLYNLLATNTEANLFDLHPPHIFQIDGNFGATAGISEAFIQSHLGTLNDRIIEILPALPKRWVNGHICGLKARGNFTFDIYFENGKITKLKIRSKHDKLLKLKLPTYIKSDLYLKNMTAGEELTLKF